MKKNAGLILSLIVVVALFAAYFAYPKGFGATHRPWRLGLDLIGGSHLIYEVDLSQIPATDQDSVLNGLRDVIEKRVNLFGVSEPQVVVAHSGTKTNLIVELAGVKDISTAIQEIGKTPALDFREVVRNGSSTPDFIKTELTGRFVTGAQLSFDSTTGKPQVSISFNKEGAGIFEKLTERNVGKEIAIFLDEAPIEIPTVQQKITGGNAVITGRFTVQSANDLVQRFNAGALPAPIKLVNQQTVSPNLGADSLRKAIVAGVVGTLLVIIFMLLYYGFFGIFSGLALIIYILLNLAVFKAIPITLTLAGFAGFILSIGMAVDANVLIFERIREEKKRGLTNMAAVDEGFKRAWLSIRDSNTSTIITAAFLYFLTSSFVRGFALTLFIGVIISMFSAITTTRLFLKIFVKNK